MRSKKINNKITLIKQSLSNHGWKCDSYGHYQRIVIRRNKAETVRLKFGKVSMRYEVKYPYGWVRLMTAFYNEVQVSKSGLITGFKR